MILSENYSNKFILILILSLFLFPNFAVSEELGKENVAATKEGIRVAVLPLENLSGTMAPIKEIRQIFIEKLRKAGVDVLNEEALEKFMAKHRIRYTGGIDKNTAQAFKQEVNVDGVFIASLEFYSDANPPRFL